ncbi:MAG: ABC transporter ATP-binding protein [bacterium]|nr:ABC transporter ATP-binding protein [bacterium]MYE67936.1 ABC transporter ATP-binding protein [Acidimicrobiia bacterium]
MAEAHPDRRRLSGPSERAAVAGERVRLDGISKHFFEIMANDSVDLVLADGEIHALLGENGAGKSTVCSILAGLYHPDSGTIRVDGELKRFASPADALAAGIGMVYQHFRLVDELSVAENIVLGHPDVPARVSRRRLAETCRQVAQRFGMELDPLAAVGELAVGQQQRVEIARLLHRGVGVLILDEPTSVLTPQESDALFANLRKLAAAGHSIVIVTHKLNEVLAVADRVTVMRAGRVVSTRPAEGATAASLSREMVGRDVERPAGRRAREPDRVVLQVEGLTVPGASKSVAAVEDVSFSVRAGEILGVCGVSGNGQRELAEALAGMRQPSSGSIRLGGKDITARSVAHRCDHGMAYIPEDRLAVGIAAGLPVEDNLMLRSYRDPALRRGPFLNYARARDVARNLIREFDVRGVRAGVPASALSGGNVQRAILAREIHRRPSLLVAASPTRGLDVRAALAVRQAMADGRESGLAVLLISEDLDEAISVSDRLIVMFEGRVVGAFSAAEASVERLGELMAGVGIEAEAA